MPKVVVYVRESDAKDLHSEGVDPAEWVRRTIKRALEARKRRRPEPPHISDGAEGP